VTIDSELIATTQEYWHAYAERQQFAVGSSTYKKQEADGFLSGVRAISFLVRNAPRALRDAEALLAALDVVADEFERCYEKQFPPFDHTRRRRD